MNCKKLKSLCDKGHIIIVTAFYPPVTGGTSVIIENLVGNLNPESYSIATINPTFSKPSKSFNIHYLMNTLTWLERFHRQWQELHTTSAVKRLVKLCKEKNAKAIVGVYPDYHFIKIANKASRITGLPLISYLHDTIAEGLSHSGWATKAKTLQDKIFQDSVHIFVMSEGMQTLYKKKYNIDVDPLEHTYPEPLKKEVFNEEIEESNIFWGGAIYTINRNSVSRVAKASGELKTKLEIASKITKDQLKNMGIKTDFVEVSFYTRDDYLKALRQQQILLLALDWPEESKMHRDELATIFPTKTIEYLHSGRPILVHCPEDYFLSKFVKAHNCGLVVTDKSEEQLKKAILKLKSNDSEVQQWVENAYKATEVFNHERLQQKFISVINDKIKTSV
jgi:glycosyltransferase involved in cell wall biosynthesis